MSARAHCARWLATICSAVPAFAQVKENDQLPVRLGEVPKVELLPAAASAPDRNEIDKLIASLADIETPDFGLSPTMAGSAFSPVEGLSHASTFVLTDHQLKQSAALRKLVGHGPAAMPQLLRALDDKTPTKLTVRHDGSFGGMWFAREMGSNPVNPVEQRVLRGWRHSDDFGSERTASSYTVKIGDVCFVAIGQIVGRKYSAVRYQPSACIVINSPVEDPKLARAVREIWAGSDSRRVLLESLLTDYATEGIFNGESLDGWRVGSELQISSATRLLFYFPKETVKMICERLAALDVSRTGPPSSQRASPSELEAFIQRETKNGVRTADFVRAVAWCKEPAIVAALKAVRDRTTDPDILQAISLSSDKP